MRGPKDKPQTGEWYFTKPLEFINVFLWTECAQFVLFPSNANRRHEYFEERILPMDNYGKNLWLRLSRRHGMRTVSPSISPIRKGLKRENILCSGASS